MAFFTWLLTFIRTVLARWEPPTAPVPAPVAPLPPIQPQVPPPAPEPVEALPTTPLWDTQKHAYHSVRVLCDEAGLTVEQKNIICACIYQESQFKNTATHVNATSTDWGICQINDHYHIGVGKDFPTVAYVLTRPEMAVAWMIAMFKAGKLSMWVSYSSGAYKQWLVASSPMWALSTPATTPALPA